MSKLKERPRAGDLYKRIDIGPHSFELKYGYYTERDKAFGEPAVIFPNLSKTKLYTEEGERIVTAVQDPCRFYKAFDPKTNEEGCIGCVYYHPPGEDIGICKCKDLT